MKKYIMLSVLILILLLTGCGEKKLTCSYSSSDSYHGSDEIFAKYIFDKNGKIDKYIINEKMTYNDKYLKDNNISIDSLYEQNKEYCKSMPSSKYIKCNFNKRGNSLTAVMEYQISKMTKEEIEKLELSDYATLSEKDIKTQFEAQGFTCK